MEEGRCCGGCGLGVAARSSQLAIGKFSEACRGGDRDQYCSFISATVRYLRELSSGLSMKI